MAKDKYADMFEDHDDDSDGRRAVYDDEGRELTGKERKRWLKQQKNKRQSRNEYEDEDDDWRQEYQNEYDQSNEYENEDTPDFEEESAPEPEPVRPQVVRSSLSSGAPRNESKVTSQTTGKDTAVASSSSNPKSDPESEEEVPSGPGIFTRLSTPIKAGCSIVSAKAILAGKKMVAPLARFQKKWTAAANEDKLNESVKEEIKSVSNPKDQSTRTTVENAGKNKEKAIESKVNEAITDIEAETTPVLKRNWKKIGKQTGIITAAVTALLSGVYGVSIFFSEKENLETALQQEGQQASQQKDQPEGKPVLPFMPDKTEKKKTNEKAEDILKKVVGSPEEKKSSKPQAGDSPSIFDTLDKKVDETASKLKKDTDKIADSINGEVSRIQNEVSSAVKKTNDTLDEKKKEAADTVKKLEDKAKNIQLDTAAGKVSISADLDSKSPNAGKVDIKLTPNSPTQDKATNLSKNLGPAKDPALDKKSSPFAIPERKTTEAAKVPETAKSDAKPLAIPLANQEKDSKKEKEGAQFTFPNPAENTAFNAPNGKSATMPEVPAAKTANASLSTAPSATPEPTATSAPKTSPFAPMATPSGVNTSTASTPAPVPVSPAPAQTMGTLSIAAAPTDNQPVASSLPVANNQPAATPLSTTSNTSVTSTTPSNQPMANGGLSLSATVPSENGMPNSSPVQVPAATLSLSAPSGTPAPAATQTATPAVTATTVPGSSFPTSSSVTANGTGQEGASFAPLNLSATMPPANNALNNTPATGYAPATPAEPTATLSLSGPQGNTPANANLSLTVPNTMNAQPGTREATLSLSGNPQSGLAVGATNSPGTAVAMNNPVPANQSLAATMPANQSNSSGMSLPTGTGQGNMAVPTGSSIPGMAGSSAQTVQGSPMTHTLSPINRYSMPGDTLSPNSTGTAASTGTMPPAATGTAVPNNSGQGTLPVTTMNPNTNSGMIPSANTGGFASSNPAMANTAAANLGTAFSNSSGRDYITKEGDNLLTIAENELGDPTRWNEIKKMNEAIVLQMGSNSHYFPVGTKLRIPEK